MLAISLPSSFLDIYSLSMSSLGCKDLCIVINIFVFLSILSFSLVHFKNDPKYLTRSNAQLFIPLMRFLLQTFVLISFVVRLK